MNDGEDWRSEYCRLYVINEVLYGQSKEQVERMQQEMNVKLNIDFSYCYVLVTGVKRHEYNRRLRIDRAHFVQNIYFHLREMVLQMGREEGFRAEFGVVNYDYSKRIVIFLSPLKPRFDPMPCARRISGWMDEQYRETGELNPHFTNITTLSGRIERYEQVNKAFEALTQLYRLAFFHRTIQPLTQELMLESRIPYSMVEAERIIEELISAIYGQEELRAQRLLQQLVLGYLKSSQDISFCRNVCFALRQRIRSLELVLGVPVNVIDEFPEMESFICIEEQYEAMLRFMHRYLFPQERKAGCPGRLSVLSVNFINQNYYKPIGLGDVAQYVHANTAYLSRVFKREMGIGISEYLNRLRVEQAARLLRETNLKVAHVAQRVGVADAHYFSSLFKRYAGISPVLYRKQHMPPAQGDSAE